VPDGRVHLIGMSFGGWLASQYALQFPARVHKLVLLSPAATVLPVSMAMVFRASFTLVPGITFRRQFYYWLLHNAVHSGPAGRAQVDEAIADWAVAERCFRQLLLMPATVLDDKTLSNWRVPTLYLVGENEKIYSAREAIARLQRVAPQIKTGLISGVGHDLWMVRATAVTSAMLDYLAESES
jgi:pimeloyl-ACP methyl ester carboxylesterase